MEQGKFSLKALEVFQAVARRGALRAAAADLGISVSTASHHLSELEKTVGRPILDHTRRPLRLTPAGETLRKRVDEAMGSLRKGLAEVWSDDLDVLVRHLRLAMIEDFDADVGPELAEALLQNAPHSDLSFLSRTTHEIMALLESEQVDLAVAAATDRALTGVSETAVLRDPFILLVPATMAGKAQTLDALADGDAALPFLRYSAEQLLGQRVEAQLRRMGLQVPRRMAFETTHVILSLVAAGRGWTITTALSFARAQRYHGQLRALPFPGRAFAREIALFCRDDLPSGVPRLAEETIRQSIRTRILGPTIGRYPWLSDQFTAVGGPQAESVAAP